MVFLPALDQSVEALGRPLAHQHVDRAVALEQLLDEVAADEAGGAGHEVGHPISLSCLVTGSRWGLGKPIDCRDTHLGTATWRNECLSKHRLLSVTATAVAALALTACGGSKGPSKADYIKKADAICKADGATVNAAAAALTNRSTTAEFAAFQKIAVPALEAENKALRALKQPKGDGATLNGIYDKVDAGVAKIKAATPAQIPAIFQSNPFAAANKDATAYGLKVCGK